MSELSRDQLAALPGGKLLKAVSLMTPLSCTTEHVQRESLRLLRCMQQDSDPARHLVMPIFITLCQQRPILCAQFSSDKVKLVSEVCLLTETTFVLSCHGIVTCFTRSIDIQSVASSRRGRCSTAIDTRDTTRLISVSYHMERREGVGIVLFSVVVFKIVYRSIDIICTDVELVLQIDLSSCM